MLPPDLASDAEQLLELVRTHMAAGRPRMARQLLERLCRLKPQDAMLADCCAHCCTNTQAWEDASRAWANAISLDGARLFRLLKRARCLIETGDFAAAQA